MAITTAQRVADDLTNQFAEGTHGDFVAQVAEPFARIVFSEYLGIGPELRDALAPPYGTGRRSHAGRGDGAMLSLLARTRAFSAAVRSPSSEQFAPEGLVDELASQIGHLQPYEVVGLMRLLYSAAVDTVAAQLPLMVAQLVAQPELRERVVAERKVDGDLLEELLRLDSPIAVVRYVVKDTELAGQMLRAGDMVLALVNVANRDPAHFLDPEIAIVPRPNVTSHIAFGWGPHRCPGARLARATSAIAIRALLTHAPSAQLDPSRQPTSTFFPLREVVSLPLVTRAGS